MQIRLASGLTLAANLMILLLLYMLIRVLRENAEPMTTGMQGLLWIFWTVECFYIGILGRSMSRSSPNPTIGTCLNTLNHILLLSVLLMGAFQLALHYLYVAK